MNDTKTIEERNKIVREIIRIRNKLEKTEINWLKALRLLFKLDRLDVDINMIPVTGIGKVVKMLTGRRDVAELSIFLIYKWIRMVSMAEQKPGSPIMLNNRNFFDLDDDENSEQARGLSGEFPPDFQGYVYSLHMPIDSQLCLNAATNRIEFRDPNCEMARALREADPDSEDEDDIRFGMPEQSYAGEFVTDDNIVYDMTGGSTLPSICRCVVDSNRVVYKVDVIIKLDDPLKDPENSADYESLEETDIDIDTDDDEKYSEDGDDENDENDHENDKRDETFCGGYCYDEYNDSDDDSEIEEDNNDQAVDDDFEGEEYDNDQAVDDERDDKKDDDNEKGEKKKNINDEMQEEKDEYLRQIVDEIFEQSNMVVANCGPITQEDPTKDDKEKVPIEDLVEFPFQHDMFDISDIDELEVSFMPNIFSLADLPRSETRTTPDLSEICQAYGPLDTSDEMLSLDGYTNED